MATSKTALSTKQRDTERAAITSPSERLLVAIKRMAFFLLLSAAPTVGISASSADRDAIMGIWNSEHRDARIEIFRCSSKYCGKIVWMDEPCYTAADKEGRPGDLKVDIKNPDPAFRKTPILGLQILNNFTFEGGNRWTGKVYDPESGNTYNAALSLGSADQLHLRGYILVPLIGRTSTWTRAQ